MPTSPRLPRRLPVLAAASLVALPSAGLASMAPADAAVTATTTTSTRTAARTAVAPTPVQAPSGVVASDAFGRTLSGSLGSADDGGAWTVTGAAGAASVSGGSALLRMATAGSGPLAALPALDTKDVDLTATIALDKLQTGGGTYVSLVSRRVVGVGDYRLKLRFQANRTVSASLVRVVGTTETTLASAPVTGLSYLPGSALSLRVRMRGGSPTSLQAKVWLTKSTEPAAWLVSATDATPALQVPGGLGFAGYLSTTATNAPMTLSVADLRASTPVTSLTDGVPAGATTATASPTYAFASNVEGATYQCRVDAADWRSCVSPTRLDALPDGAHRFTVRAVERDGRPAAAASRPLTVDTQAPTVTFTSPAIASPTTDRGAGFAVSADEPSTFECSVDGGAWAPCDAGTTVSGLADGTHTVSVRATDEAGNTGVAASRSWTVDTGTPSTALDADAGPAQGTVQTSHSARFTFSADEHSRFECLLDSGAWTACASGDTFGSLGYGVHTLSVRAIDDAGNVDPTPETRTWTVVSSVPGEVKPTADNTGVPAGTTLTPYYGNLTITTPGTVIDALDIHGFVTIKAPNVTIRRSIVRGGVATGNLGLVTNTTASATGFVIEDSTLYPEYPSVWLDAIKGSNYTARRIEAFGTVDTAKVHGDNVRIESSYFHDTVLYASDPNQHGGPTHNDGVQVLGGDNITVIGNNIVIPVTQNSAIQVTQDYRAVTRLTVTKNWLDGGSCTVNTNNKPLATMNGVTLTYNRFGRSHKYVDCAVLSQPAVTLTTAGNVWDDNSLPARLRLNG